MGNPFNKITVNLETFKDEVFGTDMLTETVASLKKCITCDKRMRIITLVFFCCCQYFVFSQVHVKDTLLFKNGNARIYQTKLLIDTVEVYNSQTDYEEFMRREGMPGSECRANYSSYYNPLSLIGSIYSYEWGYFDEAACGPPSNSLGVQTISLETGKEVSILELVEEMEIVAAFKNDSWVQRMLSEASLHIRR